MPGRIELESALASLIEVIRDVGPTGIIDILLMTALVYAALVWLRRSRASKVVQGVLLIGLVYLAARQFDLFLTSAVLEAFFAVALVALIVIFRDELRRLFERVSSWRLGARFRRAQVASPATELTELLLRTLPDLARDRVGALIVIKRRESLERHLDGGVRLNGEPSEALFKSLFDAHSIGHDGAVVLEDGVVSRFACHLPLSTSFDQLGSMGTRHAAALGLAERSDALCIVVSEERGEISAALGGELRRLDGPEELYALLAANIGAASKAPPRSGGLLGRRYRTILAAAGISMLLWLVLVDGAKQYVRRVTVPIDLLDVPAGLTAAVTPRTATLTLVGPRRNFYFFGTGAAQISLSLSEAVAGASTRTISASDVTVPKDLTLREIRPLRVRLTLRRAAKTSTSSGRSAPRSGRKAR